MGSGFTKEQLSQLHRELQPLLTSRDELQNEGVVIPKAVKMDVFFQPRVVLEVKAASVTQSPLYRGVSLRFPRFVRLRPDKKASDVTRVDRLSWRVCWIQTTRESNKHNTDRKRSVEWTPPSIPCPLSARAPSRIDLPYAVTKRTNAYITLPGFTTQHRFFCRWSQLQPGVW